MAAEKETQRVLYTATMKHDAKSVTRMAHMQYNNFIYGRRRIHLAISLLLLAFGVWLVPQSWGFVLTALGIFSLYLLDLVPRKVAKAAIKNFSGSYPSIHAFVTQTGMFTQLVEDEVAYSSVIKLIEDKRYIYVYINQVTSFMLEKDSVKGNGDVESLKAFIAEKTGLKWAKPKIL